MDKKNEFHISDEVASWIELKKSEYLSLLIEKQRHDDFGFESFSQYDVFIKGSIEEPDSVWELLEDDQMIRTYIKTYSGNPAFHQVIIGTVLKDKQSEIFIPILMFVSKYSDLVSSFSLGDNSFRPSMS